MAIFRKQISFSRLLDRVGGSALAVTRTKVEKGKLVRDFDPNKIVDSKYFRSLIDSNLPALYVLDLNLVANEIYLGLVSNSRKTISSISSAEGNLFTEDAEFDQEYPKFMLRNKALITNTLVDVMKNALEAKLQRKQFKLVIDSLEKIYVKALQELGKAKAYLGFRNASARMQRDVRLLLQAERTFIASDGNLIVSNVNKATSMLIVAPTFNKAVSDVNGILNDACKAFLQDKAGINFKAYDNKTKEGFFIGSYINAGHTAAAGPLGDVIGVNMPNAQKVQFQLSGLSTTKAYEIEEELSNVYLEAGYQINFTQNFSESAKTLLDLGFAFTITMPSELNTNKIRVEEVRRIKKVVQDELLPDLVTQARAKFKQGIVDLLPIVSASPSIVDSIEDRIAAKLEGRPYKPYRKTSKLNRLTEIAIKAMKKTGATTRQKSSVTTGMIKLNVKPANVPGSSLDILTLINQNLAERIRSNMGKGQSTNILNYRTGRFAESAKVVKVSTSRNNLITLFYSYMKNPYATFSEGGAQQHPRSRDPKKLISTSIRELAIAASISKIRSVNI